MVSVLAIGQIVYDLTIELDGFPLENGKYEVNESIETGGGPAANAAFLLSKWSVDTFLCGRVGNDIYGAKILSEFHDVNTDTSLVKVLNNYNTSFSTILVNRNNGSRTIMNRKDKNLNLHIDFTYLKKQPKVILFDGHELEASISAKENFPNATTVLDAGSVREGTLKLAPLSDYFICSEKFALEYCKMKRIDILKDSDYVIEKLKKLTAGKIVVTLGESGLIYEDKGSSKHMNAFRVDALDTTGAGDIFHGAFVYGLLRNISFEDNLKFASLTSAISVEKIGGRSSIPELSEVCEKSKKFTGGDLFEV